MEHWELKKLIQGAELITQLGVVDQGTKEGKAYYQGQYDFRRNLLYKIEELKAAPIK